LVIVVDKKIYPYIQWIFYKITRQLDQEVRHRAWLEQNIKRSNLLKDSRKQVLKLGTEQAYRKLQSLWFLWLLIV
jgi:hypothetical protein